MLLQRAIAYEEAVQAYIYIFLGLFPPPHLRQMFLRWIGIPRLYVACYYTRVRDFMVFEFCILWKQASNNMWGFLETWNWNVVSYGRYKDPIIKSLNNSVIMWKLSRLMMGLLIWRVRKSMIFFCLSIPLQYHALRIHWFYGSFYSLFDFCIIFLLSLVFGTV